MYAHVSHVQNFDNKWFRKKKTQIIHIVEILKMMYCWFDIVWVASEPYLALIARVNETDALSTACSYIRMFASLQ